MKHSPPSESTLSGQLLGAFFRFGRTPWHFLPAAGLSRSEMGILLSIQRSEHHKRAIRISDLSKVMHVSSPTITQHINNLEAQGFVDKAQDKEDKRAINLTLTDKGREALEAHHTAMNQNFIELTELLGEENVKLFISFLTKTNEFFMEKQKDYSDNFFDRR